MNANLVSKYEQVCDNIGKLSGVRFAAIINKQGKKIAGGFMTNIIPLVEDEKKLEMLFMETALDLSMRKEFDFSLGEISAIVSYREKTNIITILHGDNFLLLSSEIELNPAQVIEIAKNYLQVVNGIEVVIQ